MDLLLTVGSILSLQLCDGHHPFPLLEGDQPYPLSASSLNRMSTARKRIIFPLLEMSINSSSSSTVFSPITSPVFCVLLTVKMPDPPYSESDIQRPESVFHSHAP